MEQRTYLIAEAGVNHDGSTERALAMVDAAADCGADAVKFQWFSPEALTTATAPLAAYQTAEAGTQRRLLEGLALPEDAYPRLAERCRARGIDFLCTPFDLPSLSRLLRIEGLRFLKLASGEVANGPLLLAAARSGLPVILSTGMADLEEIGAALSILHHGYCNAPGWPKPAAPTPAVLAALQDRVTLLHCVSQYPAPVSSTHLRAMDTLARAFGLSVGFSDHSLGITLAIAAAARGARVIEKHFTHDVRAAGPDHAASLSVEDLRKLVRAVREVERGLGSAEKRCQPEEAGNRIPVRRSVVAARAIAPGEAFGEESLVCKRPATGGVAPNRLWELLGRPAKRGYAADEPIAADELENRA